MSEPNFQSGPITPCYSIGATECPFPQKHARLCRCTLVAIESKFYLSSEEFGRLGEHCENLRALFRLGPLRL